MTDLVWDAVGTRYFETGVSKGILFDMNRVGVPWNGLVSVTLDPLGGELESYYFEGVKYYDRILAEEFQATINAISTPPEFEACEGVRDVGNGMRTYFNKRSKFNLCWRTIIGNDVDSAVGYKIHIAYNCTVQPAARAYATISDNTTPDVRSFVITTTPACGRHSYFSFSSLDGDLSALEARINTGDLPGCWELLGLTSPSTGGGSPPLFDPDFGCVSLVEDLEEYIHGQVVSDTKTVLPDTSTTVSGLINNGLDIVQLDANGTYTVNDSAATVVGSGDVLADDDDATYISSADGDLGYTIGLPPLVGYVEGSALELHIRMSITGDVNADDPDVIDADAQVFITTDVDGDLPVGGFSDGTDEGVGFALTSVDGTIEDYVVPLNMDPWFDSSLEDVITALEAGAYLNVVGATNNNFDTTPEVRVYEAYILVLNDTDPDKWLRSGSLSESISIEQHVYSSGTTDLVASLSDYIDFKAMAMPNQVSYVGGMQPLNLDVGGVTVDISGSSLVIHAWDDSYGSPIGSTPLVLNKWYRAQLDWSWTTIRIRVFDVEDLGTALIDESYDSPSDPTASVLYSGGNPIGNGTVSYEVALDNAKIQVHCHDEAPPAPDWTCFDLSTATFMTCTTPPIGPQGQYDSGTGQIIDNVNGSARFYFAGFTLDPTKTYEFRAQFAAHGYYLGIMQQNPAYTTMGDNWELGFTFPDTLEILMTVGPGIDDWDSAITAGYQSLIRFDVPTGLTSLCYREV